MIAVGRSVSGVRHGGGWYGVSKQRREARAASNRQRETTVKETACSEKVLVMTGAMWWRWMFKTLMVLACSQTEMLVEVRESGCADG